MRFRCDVRPALQFEQLLETMFALDRRQDEQEGMPSPLRLAVIARAHFDVVRLPFPPAFVQRIGLALGAPLGAGSSATDRPTTVPYPCPNAAELRQAMLGLRWPPGVPLQPGWVKEGD